jgi:hypothetical protein
MRAAAQSLDGKEFQGLLAHANPVPGPGPAPHHPLRCLGPLTYAEDGTFACPHAAVPPGDERTRHAITQSIAMLLIEIAAAGR